MNKWRTITICVDTIILCILCACAYRSWNLFHVFKWNPFKPPSKSAFAAEFAHKNCSIEKQQISRCRRLRLYIYIYIRVARGFSISVSSPRSFTIPTSFETKLSRYLALSFSVSFSLFIVVSLNERDRTAPTGRRTGRLTTPLPPPALPPGAFRYELSRLRILSHKGHTRAFLK